MVLQFFCPICKEEYGAADELYSTRCGHVFHSSCLRDWLNGSSSCPCCNGQCSNADTCKVYITSRSLELEEDLLENLKLKSELEQSIKNLSECQKSLDESEKNFMQLHLQLDVVNNERLDLLHEKRYLQTIVEGLEQELHTKNLENNKLKENLDVSKSQVESLCSLPSNNNDSGPLSAQFANLDINKELIEKDRIIDDLRKQLQDKSLELEKEIRNSTMLIVEKMKLQTLVNANKMPRKQRAASVTNKSGLLAAPRTQGPPLARAFSSEQISNLPVDGFAGGAVRKVNVAPGTHQRMDKQVYSLFQYAKKLYRFGFKYVYAENNAIFAKTHDGCAPLQILNRQQVDEFANKFKAFTAEVAASTK